MFAIMLCSLRLEAAGCPYECHLVDALRGLGEKEKKLLVGQGFNMEVVTMLTVFMLGNMVERLLADRQHLSYVSFLA